MNANGWIRESGHRQRHQPLYATRFGKSTKYLMTLSTNSCIECSPLSKMAVDTADVDSLRSQWTQLYSKTLPHMARERDPAQPEWPVRLDHCFARIILDNTVGEGSQQWDKVIKKPAVRNMTAQQLQNAIELGDKVRTGEMDLQELDQISLMCRGKNEGRYGKHGNDHDAVGAGNHYKKRKQDGEISQSPPSKISKQEKSQSTLSFERRPKTGDSAQLPSPPQSDEEVPGSKVPESTVDFKATLERIQNHKGLTPYRTRLYTILLSVPRGKHTTYAAMSDYLNSSARAVGSGMRNNPFAPEVPCHRVLAADGSLGGFHGSWGREGKYADKKLALLRGEGVRFDGKGKVVGEPFRKFHEFEDFK